MAVDPAAAARQGGIGRGRGFGGGKLGRPSSATTAMLPTPALVPSVAATTPIAAVAIANPTAAAANPAAPPTASVAAAPTNNLATTATARARWPLPFEFTDDDGGGRPGTPPCTPAERAADAELLASVPPSVLAYFASLELQDRERLRHGIGGGAARSGARGGVEVRHDGLATRWHSASAAASAATSIAAFTTASAATATPAAAAAAAAAISAVTATDIDTAADIVTVTAGAPSHLFGPGWAAADSAVAAGDWTVAAAAARVAVLPAEVAVAARAAVREAEVAVDYRPTIIRDRELEPHLNGFASSTLHSVSAMPEHRHVSVEEMRFAAYRPQRMPVQAIQLRQRGRARAVVAAGSEGAWEQGGPSSAFTAMLPTPALTTSVVTAFAANPIVASTAAAATATLIAIVTPPPSPPPSPTAIPLNTPPRLPTAHPTVIVPAATTPAAAAAADTTTETAPFSPLGPDLARYHDVGAAGRAAAAVAAAAAVVAAAATTREVEAAMAQLFRQAEDQRLLAERSTREAMVRRCRLSR